MGRGLVQTAADEVDVEAEIVESGAAIEDAAIKLVIVLLEVGGIVDDDVQLPATTGGGVPPAPSLKTTEPGEILVKAAELALEHAPVLTSY
jgi:hypothetical protein